MEDTDELRWRKARRSSGNGAECVEVGTTAAGRAAGIRDSKSPERGHLAVTPEMLGALLDAVKVGQLDLPLGVGGMASAMEVMSPHPSSRCSVTGSSRGMNGASSNEGGESE